MSRVYIHDYSPGARTHVVDVMAVIPRTGEVIEVPGWPHDIRVDKISHRLPGDGISDAGVHIFGSRYP